MHLSRRYVVFLVVLLAVGLMSLWSISLVQAFPLSARDSRPTPPPNETITEIEQAIASGMSLRATYQPVYAITQSQVSNIRVSTDEAWASAWLTVLDPETEEPIPTEPGLVLLQKMGEIWTPAFPGDDLWLKWLNTAPEDAVPAGEKGYWLLVNQQYEENIPSAALTGYLLPWPNGLTRKLSGSVLHDSYITSGNAHYSFDFYLSQQMWNIHASKAGTVKRFKDSVPTNDHSDVNYIVIQDSPTTFQLYMHLAQNSIPAELKVVGAPVQQGQFIGIADNTGDSTGHHLHFMVHTNPSSYWGTSVDIVFGDVQINGGRPRLKRLDLPDYNDEPYCWPNAKFPTKPKDECSQFQESYVSGNVYHLDNTPPTGGLTAPNFGANIASQTVTVSGWATDAGTGLQSAQIRAYFNGAWQDIGPVHASSPFNYSWNMCNSNVPDGPVSLSLRLVDNVNNSVTYESLRTFVKNFNCPMPTPLPPAVCAPAANQVALFSGDNYRGECVVKSAGSYATGADLSPVGDDKTVSIKVGANVLATLYSESSFSGRAETLARDDSNLSDNLVGVNKVSSMLIQLRTTSPPPNIPEPVWPAASGIFTQTLSLSLYWRDKGGGSQFQARLTGASGTITSTWLTEPFWHLGTGVGSFGLVPGPYSWQVRASNSAGTSAWSPARALTIVSKTISPATPVTVPFTDPLENIGGWRASGLWHHEADKPAASPTHTWWFGYCNSSGSGCDEYYYNGKTGDLTSPPIQLPASPNYYLRFKYRYQTESLGRFWDQRWVQIKVDNGPFINLYQFSDDGMLYTNSPFLSSPVIDLSPYTGQPIQVRFHFDTMDVSGQTGGGDNDYEGWFIDDVSVTTTPPANCPALDVGGNTPDQAFILSMNSPITDAVCPAGDLDYFKFSGTAGTWVSANTEGGVSSSVDTVLQLLGEDGSSILAENDDERPPEILDSFIRFYIPRTGSYTLKVKEWGHPGAGGSNYPYTVGVYQDAVDPSADIVFPTSTTLISQTIDLKAQVSDVLSGVDRVEFYFHDYQWSDPTWKLLGYGTLEQGYWTLPFDPSTEAVQFNAAFLILAYDRAGNVYADPLWNARLAEQIYFTALPVVFNTSP